MSEKLNTEVKKIEEKITREFISKEPRRFHVRLGHRIASSLSGFTAGVIVASIIWILGIIVFRLLGVL
jgi:acid phosphatase family membrane protein YuiD